MSRQLTGLVIAMLLWLLPQAGLPATVVGVVSERSAPQLAAGAERLVEAHPDHSVVLRTPEQLARLSDEELASFFSRADALLLAAVFGDQVGRLQQEIAAQASRQRFPILAINGDQRLTRLSRLDGERVMAGVDDDALDELVAAPEPGVAPMEHLRGQQAEYPRQAQWLEGRAYYQGRSAEHMEELLRWLLVQAGNDLTVADPQPRASIRYYQPDQDSARPDPRALELERGDAVAIVDLDTGDRPGDRALLDALCRQLEARDIQCFAVLANWGGATVEAIRSLPETVGEARLGAIVALQDFTLGGGDGRREVTEALTSLDVPVLKGIRLAERTREQWRLSSDGMPPDTVHYQLAMPELQGISQPMVLATAAPPTIDERTGVRLALSRPVSERVESMAGRLQHWLELRRMDNADKRIALIYYNHPPGRQNIGADNLDVPESIFQMLTWLRDAGFETGELPDSADALLDRMQQRGVNMLQDQSALAEMAGRVPSLSGEQYRAYYDTLPTAVRAELEDGPLGYLHAQLVRARDSQEIELAQELLTRRIKDIRHLIEQHEHPAQARALDLLDQYESGWAAYLEEGGDAQRLAELRDALMDTGIPGLSGWGEPPGRSMVHDGRMLFPGLRFGNIFIGPQPPRGWEIDEELLHANTTFPPTHQYVGFYHWLRDHFEADALVYTGRHSTREFLPRRRAGLTRDDYPDLLGGDLPLIYPYIVDGVGEGIQAKRRAMGVMISHLTPPLAATELYDELLELRQLVETYESSVETDSPTRNRAVDTLRERVAELNLSSDLEREIANEQGVPPDEVSLEDVSADLLVHEVGHYLTDMQERFMPLGLHVFGQAWDEESVETMLTSMAGPDEEPRSQWREALEASPAAERERFMAALDGRFVPPGQGNDPVRTPEVLPTGRNFHALSSDLIPTRVAWSLGSEMAGQARQRGGDEGSEALVLWASDTVRDEGVMIAFGLNLLGVRPQWNSRGIVEGLERMSLTESENV